ncbi:MAG: hypothetical protein P1U36_00090 [Legionellaceae bacterium]|nr:hypothetical protein [Legionellaceae bacterium]
MPDFTQSNDKVLLLENPLFQALMASGEVSFYEETGGLIVQQHLLTDMEYTAGLCAQLQELQAYIGQDPRAYSEAWIQNMTLVRVASFAGYKQLFTYGILTLHEVLDLNAEQMKSIDRLEAFVRESLDIESRGIRGMLASVETVAHCILQMLKDHVISQESMLDFPYFTHTSPPFCALIVRGKISLKQAQLFTAQTKIHFSGYNTYYLILADVLTIKQVLQLKQDKLCQIERLNLREIKVDDAFNKSLRLAVQEEAIEFIKSLCNPQTSQSFMFFNQTIMDMERRHINTHVWHQIKERVATRMWDKFHFAFLSLSDPGFIERIDAGQDIKLARSSEVQRLMENSEGYCEYCRHTMFSSCLLRKQSWAEEPGTDAELSFQ